MSRRLWIILFVIGASCAAGQGKPSAESVKPRVVTVPVKHDSDDPAIWVDRKNPANSLVLGTDKDADGALYVFGLDGKPRTDRYSASRGITGTDHVDGDDGE